MVKQLKFDMMQDKRAMQCKSRLHEFSPGCCFLNIM